ncbi:TetR/AcrR family transcriptional regulator [Archangium violaceum]|uniref:TetR/AcrR family transcriptional regulator n=1 Tax=Archangium violaceum TaxID=83451 RepID=UPI00193B5073|nr:TetR/AcrR family transcriptional regulator [Archangium violaceum]QRK06995.1 TetR/AcrR family transcriptional regulator [Archangium violaceum]
MCIITDDFVNFEPDAYIGRCLLFPDTMPKTTVPKRPQRSRQSPKPSTDEPTEKEPRGARRKRETRARLLEAALQLMSERGMEGVAINEITEAADVGFGSFYNHFESKEAIYEALVDTVFEDFADALDRLTADISDPAEVLAVSVRHALRRAQREPVWGRFLVREGLSARAVSRGLGQRLLRDIQKGLAAKRFKAEDPLMTFIAVGGTVLGALSAELHFGTLDASQAAPLDSLGLRGDELPERTAAMLLRTLGLSSAEAGAVSRRPLPEGGFVTDPAGSTPSEMRTKAR